MPETERTIGELLWGEQAERRRGPAPALALEDIVAAATTVADQDGVAAVSMSRVAREVGFTTMALYRYIPRKADLVTLMVDHAAAESPIPVAETDWRESLESWWHHAMELYRRHRWLLAIDLTEIPFGPHRLRWLESGLAALATTTLPGDERVAAILVLDSASRAAAQHEQLTSAQAKQPAALTTVHYATDLRHQSSFPHLNAAFGEQAGSSPSGATASYFAMQIFLDGIEARIRHWSTSAPE